MWKNVAPKAKGVFPAERRHSTCRANKSWHLHIITALFHNGNRNKNSTDTVVRITVKVPLSPVPYLSFHYGWNASQFTSSHRHLRQQLTIVTGCHVYVTMSAVNYSKFSCLHFYLSMFITKCLLQFSCYRQKYLHKKPQFPHTTWDVGSLTGCTRDSFSS